jgi:hypothetical protein
MLEYVDSAPSWNELTMTTPNATNLQCLALDVIRSAMRERESSGRGD